MKGILIEPASDEETKLIVAFIQEHRLKSFILKESTATEIDYWNDLIRLLIPLT
jgi:hypothetical protein